MCFSNKLPKTLRNPTFLVSFGALLFTAKWEGTLDEATFQRNYDVSHFKSCDLPTVLQNTASGYYADRFRETILFCFQTISFDSLHVQYVP